MPTPKKTVPTECLTIDCTNMTLHANYCATCLKILRARPNIRRTSTPYYYGKG